MALRAILRLRARMTEQADILATGNKSPRQHSRLPVRGWCPRASWSEQRLCHPPSLPLAHIGEKLVGGLALDAPHP